MNRIFTLIFRVLQTKIFSCFSHVVDQVRLDFHWCPFSSSRLFGVQLISTLKGCFAKEKSAIWFWPRESFFGYRVRARQDFRTAPTFIMHTVLCLKKTIAVTIARILCNLP